MAAPSLITASGAQTPGSLFNIGSSLYAFVLDANQIQVWLSTDAGVTWNEQDSAGRPNTNSSGTPGFATDGTILYAVYTNTSNVMAVSQFDTSSNLWTTTTVTTNSPNPADTYVGYRAVDFTLIVYGAPDSLQIIGPPLQQRIGVFLFDTSALTFTNWVQSSGSIVTDDTVWDPVAVLQGNGNEFILISVQSFLTGFPGASFLWYQTFNGSTPSSVIQIDTAPTDDIFWQSAKSNGSELVVAWQTNQSGTPQDLNVWKSPTAPIGWALGAISATGPINGWAQEIDADGTINLLLSITVGGNSPFLQYQDAGAGFGLPSTVLPNFAWFVGATAQINSSTPGWGIQFVATGGIFYLASTVISVITGLLSSAGLQFAPIPSIGAVCRFGRDKRPGGHPPRTIQVGKAMSYPDWYVS